MEPNNGRRESEEESQRFVRSMIQYVVPELQETGMLTRRSSQVERTRDRRVVGKKGRVRKEVKRTRNDHYILPRTELLRRDRGRKKNWKDWKKSDEAKPMSSKSVMWRMERMYQELHIRRSRKEVVETVEWEMERKKSKIEEPRRESPLVNPCNQSNERVFLDDLSTLRETKREGGREEGRERKRERKREKESESFL